MTGQRSVLLAATLSLKAGRAATCVHARTLPVSPQTETFQLSSRCSRAGRVQEITPLIVRQRLTHATKLCSAGFCMAFETYGVVQARPCQLVGSVHIDS